MTAARQQAERPQIVVTERYIPIGMTGKTYRQDRYAWEGDPHGVVMVPYRWLWRAQGQQRSKPLGRVFHLGALRLRVVDFYPESASMRVAVMRDGWRAVMRSLWYPWLHRLGHVYRLLIVTAAIWGHADFTDGRVPSWCDLHLAQRISRAFHRRTV